MPFVCYHMPLYGRDRWDGVYIILQIVTIQVILKEECHGVELVLLFVDLRPRHLPLPLSIATDPNHGYPL